jgi:hypothetical protein
MLDRKLITPEEAEHHPDASVLTRSLGHHDHEVEIDIEQHPLAVGDTLLLCSDGLWGFVPEHGNRESGSRSRSGWKPPPIKSARAWPWLPEATTTSALKWRESFSLPRFPTSKRAFPSPSDYLASTSAPVRAW